MTDYDKTFALFMQPCLGPDLVLSLSGVVLISQMTAIGFGDSLSTVTGAKEVLICLSIHVY